MALQKTPVNIDFSKGLDLKSDPKQVSPGYFLKFENSIFTKGKRLGKRNGYLQLTSLPTASQFVTTFQGNLTALGTNLYAYSQANATWTSKAMITPLSLSTQSLIRNNANQTSTDSVLASNGFLCEVFGNRYAIIDTSTGQNIIPGTIIPVTIGAVSPNARVYLLGSYFIIVFINTITSTKHLQFIAISTVNPTQVTVATDISALVGAGDFEAVVAGNKIYVAWDGSGGGGEVRMTYLNTALAQGNTIVVTGNVANLISLSVDMTGSTPVLYCSYYDSTTFDLKCFVVDYLLVSITAPVTLANSGGTNTFVNITSVATAGVMTELIEVSNTYSYSATYNRTNLLKTITMTQAGVVGTLTTVSRALGLASKAFYYGGVIYFLAAFNSTNQPTYFLLNLSGKIIAKLAYANAALSTSATSYVPVLSNITLSGSKVYISYLVKDQIQSVNKTQGAQVSSAFFSQAGVNLVIFNFAPASVSTAEIGNDLHLSGGIFSMYDGYDLVESGFHVWPEPLGVATSGTGGLLIAQQYYYVAVYEWSDNQGNIFRSSGSIPVGQVTSGSTSSNTVNIPTLRLTSKTKNPVKLTLYRWSTAQQTYYQVTSVISPTFNNTTVDSISFVDTLADTSIIGNPILYTTGGVIENIGAPATDVMALYNSRLFMIDSEDRNLVWFSKQVIESTPVEMSDLLTIYVAPTIGAQGDTGPLTTISAMDDKLLLFKSGAIYYLTGKGPDNTGANNDFSDPIFITSTVGCSNPSSIVFVPQGIMFQSDKGIWILGRDLSTSYIGAPVEDYNSATVLSALTVPGTNQVRFTLNTGVTLMYDYYFNQWGAFTGVPALSSTIYKSLHTFIDSFGRVFQENVGSFLDGSKPVLMSFKTGWIALGGLQGFQRAYLMNLAGTYISPHKLSVSVAQDYAPSPSQIVTITPDNYSSVYGSEPLYGSSQYYGGVSDLEQWQVYFKTQKCEAVQIEITEQFDPSYGTVAGAGLTLSGLNFVIGVKSGYPRIPDARSVG